MTQCRSSFGALRSQAERSDWLCDECPRRGPTARPVLPSGRDHPGCHQRCWAPNQSFRVLTPRFFSLSFVLIALLPSPGREAHCCALAMQSLLLSQHNFHNRGVAFLRVNKKKSYILSALVCCGNGSGTFLCDVKWIPVADCLFVSPCEITINV